MSVYFASVFKKTHLIFLQLKEMFNYVYFSIYSYYKYSNSLYVRLLLRETVCKTFASAKTKFFETVIYLQSLFFLGVHHPLTTALNLLNLRYVNLPRKIRETKIFVSKPALVFFKQLAKNSTENSQILPSLRVKVSHEIFERSRDINIQRKNI